MPVSRAKHKTLAKKKKVTSQNDMLYILYIHWLTNDCYLVNLLAKSAIISCFYGTIKLIFDPRVNKFIKAFTGKQICAHTVEEKRAKSKDYFVLVHIGFALLHHSSALDKLACLVLCLQ